jgi:DNA-binding beta-propeller fold protein YncE
MKWFGPSRSSSVLGMLLLAAVHLQGSVARAAEPNLFIMGVWPDRLRLFDQTTESFVGELRLRHGAVTWYGNALATADFGRLFFITDRLESVEVLDTSRGAIVDSFKLSTSNRKVRLMGALPSPDGKLVYLTARAVKEEADRFIAEEPQIVVYDPIEHEVEGGFSLPTDGTDFPYPLAFSADGQSLFVLGEDVYELSTTSYEVVDKLELSKPLLAGYGPIQRSGDLTQAAPGIFYGIYRSADPFLKKTVVGVTRVDLNDKKVESFELGPDLRLGRFALSPDGTRGYAGLTDLVAIDMESRVILATKKNVEQGRNNTSMIVSADGTKLFVSGVGNFIRVYDASTLEPIREIFVGGDLMSEPQEIPGRASMTEARN